MEPLQCLKSLVFPARAGMIRDGGFAPYPVEGIPRESGDDPEGLVPAIRTALYSPRERG